MSFLSDLAVVASELSGKQADIVETNEVLARIQDGQRTRAKRPRRLSKRFNPSGLFFMCQAKEVRKRLQDVWHDLPRRTTKQVDDDIALSALGLAGTAIHNAYQDRELAPIPGLLWGSWKNLDTGEIVGPCFNTELPGLGPEGSDEWYEAIENNWKYVEVYLRIESELGETYAVSGRIDGVVAVEDGWEILEIKTLDDDYIRGLRRVSGPEPGQFVLTPDPFMELPRPKDIFQAKLYASMLIRALGTGLVSGLDPGACRGVTLLYISRNNPDLRRAFHFPVDEYALVHQEQQIRIIHGLVEAGTPDDAEKRCRSRTSGPALFCPFKDQCFPKKTRGKAQQPDTPNNDG